MEVRTIPILSSDKHPKFQKHRASGRAVVPLDGTIGMGIYKLEGDLLTIAHTEAGQDRPKEFATKPGTPLTLMILERLKP